MFGETTISYIEIWNHPIETTIYKQMFQVPGKYQMGPVTVISMVQYLQLSMAIYRSYNSIYNW